MPRKIFVLLLVAAFILNSGILYSGEPLVLEALIQEAKEKNPDILAAKKRWEASLARIPQVKSLDNPTVGISFMKIQKGTLKLGGTMPEDRLLSISQMFPFFGKLPLKGKIAMVESQMLASEYKDKELVVVNRLKNTYYDLFMNYKEIGLSRQSLEFLDAIAKIAETKYAVGDISQEKVFKIHLELASLNNNIANLEQEKSAIQTRINTLLNREPESPLGVPDIGEGLYFKKDARYLYQAAILNQPELIIFSYAVEKNKYAKSLAKKSFFPDMMADVALRGITSGNLGPWDLMLAFSVPFWFWTKQRYEVKEAIANLEEAEAAYKAMQNKAFQEVKDLVTKVEVAINTVKLYKNNLIPILESSIESSLADFRSGEGDVMMLLDSERMLLDTKMSYYKTLVKYNMNLADLERTAGIDLKEVEK